MSSLVDIAFNRFRRWSMGDTSPRPDYGLIVVQIPVLRLGGFSLITLGIVAHNAVVLKDFSPAHAASYASLFIGYSLISWLVLFLFFNRT